MQTIHMSMRLTARAALWGLALASITLPAIAASPAKERFQYAAPDGLRSAIAPPVPLARMVGHMIVTGFSGQSRKAPGVRLARQLLDEGKIGGVILMSWNLTNRARLIGITRSLTEAAGTVPPVIGIDQEGGAVQRLKRKHGFRTTPSAYLMARRFTAGEAEQRYSDLAWQLRRAGINTNFGPVLDLARNPQSPIIARRRRAYGARPEPVIVYGRAFIRAHRRAGILTAAKHFPGHGSSLSDSHRTLVNLSRTWAPVELMPFWALSDPASGPDMVMTGHLYHPRFSERRLQPASLSAKAIQTELRGVIGFRGLVITDDLEMAPVRRLHPLGELAVRAALAGNDLLLISTGAKTGRRNIELMHGALMKAVADGRIPRESIEASYRRIMAAKLWIAQQRLPPPLPVWNVQTRASQLGASR